MLAVAHLTIVIFETILILNEMSEILAFLLMNQLAYENYNILEMLITANTVILVTHLSVYMLMMYIVLKHLVVISSERVM